MIYYIFYMEDLNISSINSYSIKKYNDRNLYLYIVSFVKTKFTDCQI